MTDAPQTAAVADGAHTTAAPVPAAAPQQAQRCVFAISLDGELYLFERALHAERFAYATRASFPIALGSVRVHDDVAAQQLLAQLHARS